MMPRLLSVGLVSLLGAAACAMGPGAGSTSPASLASSTPGAASATGRLGTASPSAPPVAAELTIYAAASLKGALADAEAAYEAANPGIDLVVATDSSAALATQIGQGAPADVFLSADSTNPQKLIDQALADGPAVTFAGNELTVIVPTDDPADIRTPADLARAGVRVIAAGDEVPITKYVAKLVQNLANVAGYPADFAIAYAANVATKEDNVKAVVAKVELGEGDAAIVYVTDAAASDKVTTVPVPDGANVSATYDAVVVASSSHPTEARAFLDWLAGPAGQAVLGAFGFLSPP